MPNVSLCLWAVCLFLSWIGCGQSVLRLLRFSELSWPFSGVIGASLFIFVGGFLNLASLVNRPALIALVVLGDILFLLQLGLTKDRLMTHYSSFVQLPVYTRVLAVVCAVILLVISMGSLCYPKFNWSDDLFAYLTYPVKLLQLGSLPFDPFSERRIQSGLGASYFLQSFMLVAGDVRSLWFPDAGAGLILFAGCVYRAGRRLENAVLPCLGLALLVIAIPLFHGNLGMTVLPASIFASMFLAESAPRTSPILRSAMLGLLAAAVTALKSTYLPAAVLILPLMHLLRIRNGTMLRTIRDALVSALALLAVLVPWMLDMKRKEGTLLYPLLGKGYEMSAYGPVPHFISPGSYPAVVGLVALFIFVFAAIVHWLAANKASYAAQISTLVLAIGLVQLPLSVSVEGASIMRYTMPFDLPFVLILLASLMRISANGWTAIRRLAIAYLFTGGMILTMGSYAMTHDRFAIYALSLGHPQAFYFYKDVGGISATLNNDNLWRERQIEPRLQDSIPPGEAVYANSMPTFSMDFRRNPIFISDYPGMSSLPPGMPTQGTPAELRIYFLNKSIRYIAYNVSDVSNTDMALGFQRVPGWTWPLRQGMTASDVNHRVVALAHNYRVIYDDGDERVIDLLQLQPAGSAEAGASTPKEP